MTRPRYTQGQPLRVELTGFEVPRNVLFIRPELGRGGVHTCYALRSQNVNDESGWLVNVVDPALGLQQQEVMWVPTTRIVEDT